MTMTMNDQHHIQTYTLNGRDWDEIDREEMRLLGGIIGGGQIAGGWELMQVETVKSEATKVSGLDGVKVTVRAYFRRPSRPINQP
jgi:hypothetical protein